MTEKAAGGVFSEATDRRIEEVTESVRFERRFYAHDIAGSTGPQHVRSQIDRGKRKLEG